MKPAALIHAGSMTLEETLDNTTIQRMDRAIELLDNHEVEHLILAAGHGSKARITPEGVEIRVGQSLRSMSQDMINYLSWRGIPSRYVLSAPWGRDTVGEIYFAQQAILKPRDWHELFAVTSEWHAPRTKMLHEFILGPRYHTTMVTVRTETDKYPVSCEATNPERARLHQFYEHFGDINPGDSAAIEKRMYDTHLLYKSLPPMKQVKFFE